MPKQGTVQSAGPTIQDSERVVLKRLCNSLDIHPRDVVVLKSKRSSRHKDFDQADPSTWELRRYLFKRNEAIYELYLDVEREVKRGENGAPIKNGDGSKVLVDEDPIGKYAEAVLVDFPTEEMAVRFAQIAARKARRGGQKRIIPVGHPDYTGSVDSERPDDRGVKLEKVSIATLGGVDDMEGTVPVLGEGEGLDSDQSDALGDVSPS